MIGLVLMYARPWIVGFEKPRYKILLVGAAGKTVELLFVEVGVELVFDANPPWCEHAPCLPADWVVVPSAQNATGLLDKLPPPPPPQPCKAKSIARIIELDLVNRVFVFVFVINILRGNVLEFSALVSNVERFSTHLPM